MKMDTIAAVATGGTVSAIGILRISGPDAISIADSVFRAKSGKSLSDTDSRKLVYGSLLDSDGEVLDLVMCTVSRAPNTYTGEDTAEFQCHGSPMVMAEGLRALFACGARQAEAGEFTKRAFLNGRLDLTQAEAVIDIIDAETPEAAKNAAGQLGGAMFRRIDKIYSEMVDIMSHFQAVLDYPDEEIPDFKAEEYLEILSDAECSLNGLLATFDRGRILRSGVKCAIIGRPNTGKSSLLNALLGYERAIVTDIAGTTRDTIEERVRIGKVMLRLSDTAGLRETDDIVERLGVERARSAAEEAELVIGVFDGSKHLTDDDKAVILQLRNAERSIAVINKDDLGRYGYDPSEFKGINTVFVSAVTRFGICELCDEIERMFPQGMSGVTAGEILTNARQAEAVRDAVAAIEKTRCAIAEDYTPDIVLTGVEEAASALGGLTGKYIADDIIQRIFERFCVGK